MPGKVGKRWSREVMRKCMEHRMSIIRRSGVAERRSNSCQWRPSRVSVVVCLIFLVGSSLLVGGFFVSRVVKYVRVQPHLPAGQQSPWQLSRRRSNVVVMKLAIHTIPKSLYPPRVPVDYEKLLRDHEPHDLNYNTQLRERSDVVIEKMDALYARLWDKKVLLKQLYYFVDQDDFSTVRRLLKENPRLICKEEASRLIPDIAARIRIKVPRDIMDLPESNVTKARNHPQELQLLLERAQDEAHKQINRRVKFILDGFWEHEATKPKKYRVNRFKYKRKLDMRTISPYLLPPPFVDEELKAKVNFEFEDAVNKDDVSRACLYIRKHTRLLDVTGKEKLIWKFLDMFEQMHKCGKYTAEELKHLRKVWWTTMYKPRVLVKLMELYPHKTSEEMKADCVKKTQAYREKKKKENYEKWMKRGVDVSLMTNDFSDARGYDWLAALTASGRWNGTVEGFREAATAENWRGLLSSMKPPSDYDG